MSLIEIKMATVIERKIFGDDFTDDEIDELMSWELYPSIEGQRSSSTGIWHPVTWRFHGICGARVHISYQYHQDIYDAAKSIPRQDPRPVSLMACVPIELKHFFDPVPNEDYDIAGRLLVIA